jgi:hypothetical protein
MLTFGPFAKYNDESVNNFRKSDPALAVLNVSFSELRYP